jgi:tRNA threonylcarbamoyladenosine biosynthesis protein TsaB
MRLLSLDTSTRYASIALCSDEIETDEIEAYGEYTWGSANNHGVELLEYIRRLLGECRIILQQLDAIAVAIGPGSFNGVRVALATAKTLAFVLQKPLIGVNTLDSIAVQQRHTCGPVCAVLEAGRSELYAACYVFEEPAEAEGAESYRMRRLGDYMLCSPQSLAASLQEHRTNWLAAQDGQEYSPLLFCGEISAASRQALSSYLQGQCRFVSELEAPRHAAVLASLALQRLRDKQVDDPLALEPLYLRRPSITKSTRKQPLLGVTQ